MVFNIVGSAANPYSKCVRDLKVGGNTFHFYDLKSFEDARLGMSVRARVLLHIMCLC